MILIVSQSNDRSTGDVMDWLLAWGKQVVRVNDNDTIRSIRITMDKQSVSVRLLCGNKEIDLSEVESFWFRRGGFIFDVPSFSDVNWEYVPHLQEHLIDECRTMKDFFISLLESKPSLGNYHQGNANKLYSLYVARKVGLAIPQTIVSSSKDDLLAFYGNNRPCITKSVQDVLSFQTKTHWYGTTTSEVVTDDIARMHDSFFPSQLQAEVRKRYELRIFYLKGKCYSMAIFSQENEQTSLDFRNYCEEKPNRYVPYLLPDEIEGKIGMFMRKMDLDTGSLDMIVTPEQEYVFLEVNPVGQYDMVSVPCNYYLHKRIAEVLCHE